MRRRFLGLFPMQAHALCGNPRDINENRLQTPIVPITVDKSTASQQGAAAADRSPALPIAIRRAPRYWMAWSVISLFTCSPSRSKVRVTTSPTFFFERASERSCVVRSRSPSIPTIKSPTTTLPVRASK